MSLLIPLGLLGLLGLIALLVIYLLKPNYQQKVVSSTFIWKLSLKYKKRSIPISRLRNLLILLCQILFICCAAMILAQPAIVTGGAKDYEEKIIIIDASADMFAEYEGQTRFERAVSEVQTEASKVLNGGGYVSVIYAGNEAEISVLRADKSELDKVGDTLQALECSYGTADISGAMKLAEDLLAQNSEAEVVLYSGTHYANEGNNVTVKYVSVEGEWNAAILSAKAELVDNFFEFTIEVASYGGGDRTIDISCMLSDYNGTGENIEVPLPPARVQTRDGETMTVIYSANVQDMTGYNVTYIHLDEGVYAFDRMFVSLGEQDSISFDNEYYVYGAVRPRIKIYYYTKSDNPFYTAFISALEEDTKSIWKIDIKEARSGDIENEGYDFYLYENAVPDILPTDGVIFLANPNKSGDAGFELGSVKVIPQTSYDGDGVSLAPGVEHPITEYIEASLIRVTQYTQVDEASLDGYDVLMYYEGNPVFFVKNEPGTKIGVVTFGTKYSTFNVNFLFPMFMRCLFDYYFPTTFSGNAFDVYSQIDFTPRGTELNLRYQNSDVTLTPSENGDKWTATVVAPGTYTVSQTLLNSSVQSENFYVTVPVSESNVVKTEDLLVNPYVEKVNSFTFDDLLIYFAAAIVLLLFLERLLQLQEGM